MNNLTISLGLAAALALGPAGFAQRGGHPGGAGSMGSMGSTHSSMGRPADAGNSGMSNHSASGSSSQSPERALSNQKLDTSLTKALQKSGVNIPGGNLASACSGFKNLGQCVAALHVAKNLNLSFSDLQAKMAGGDSLGKAIQSMGGPNVDAKAEAKKAAKQANQDIQSAQTAS